MANKGTEKPIEKTYRALLASRRPNAAGAIAFGVLNCKDEVRRLAIESAFECGERPALEAVLRIFHSAPEDLQEKAISLADKFLPVLRHSLRDADKLMRANICDYLVRMNDTRVAHLLADLLQDSVEGIKKQAQDGLLGLAAGYHRLAIEVENGEKKVSRQAIETKRYALLDALLTALRFYALHERPEMIAALLSLDRRGDEVLIDILANPMDRRRKIILDILETATYPRAISFLLTALGNKKTASVAREVLETRFDLDFIKALLSEGALFSNKRTVTALGGVEFVPWLRPGTEKATALPDVLGVRALRFLLFSGTKSVEKLAILERLSQVPKPALAAAAKFALTALSKQVTRDRVDIGLTKISDRLGSVETPLWEPEIDQLVKERVRNATDDGSGLLSDETLFRNFMNSFETFSRSEREAAISDFRAKGILIRETAKALGDSEAETVLRAVKIVEYTDNQNELARELAVLTRHPDRRVRSAVVRQLGKSGAYDALRALFETLGDRDRRVLANAVEALEETGHRQIVRLLDPLMKHPDNRVRANAAKAAWTLGDEKGRTVLVEMLSSRRAEMRLSGLWGLRQIGVRSEVDAIRNIAKNDADERVRNSADMTIIAWENAQ